MCTEMFHKLVIIIFVVCEIMEMPEGLTFSPCSCRYVVTSDWGLDWSTKLSAGHHYSVHPLFADCSRSTCVRSSTSTSRGGSSSTSSSSTSSATTTRGMSSSSTTSSSSFRPRRHSTATSATSPSRWRTSTSPTTPRLWAPASSAFLWGPGWAYATSIITCRQAALRAGAQKDLQAWNCDEAGQLDQGTIHCHTYSHVHWLYRLFSCEIFHNDFTITPGNTLLQSFGFRGFFK